MAYAIVYSIGPDTTMLVPEDDEDFEIIVKTEWLPPGIREGDMLEINFEAKPRKQKESNVYYLKKINLDHLRE